MLIGIDVPGRKQKLWMIRAEFFSPLRRDFPEMIVHHPFRRCIAKDIFNGSPKSGTMVISASQYQPEINATMQT